ncbi:MAG: hypothetical protein AABZ44_09540 [Elusimicrobiota bacterium]
MNKDSDTAAAAASPMLESSLQVPAKTLQPGFWADWKAQGQPLGFLRQPGNRQVAALTGFAKSLGKVRDYCLIGIGGSALPCRSVHDFFAPRARAPRLSVIDTIDPDALQAALEPVLAHPQETLFHVVSKSGKTLEVELVRQLVETRLQTALPDSWKDRIVVTTSPGAGNPLERWAKRNRIRIFPLDQDIGGRFCTFTPVTYMWAALAGLDLSEFWQGAQGVIDEPGDALAYAEHMHRQMRRGRNILGLCLYGGELERFGDFLQQLFAESLGKDGKGITPYKFIGTKDQHSLLQLYLDGPKDKQATIISIRKSMDSAVGRAFAGAQYGVAQSFKERGVPFVTLRVRERTPAAYGALVSFFHIATIGLGRLMGVNPFDQPMVELQKRYTREYLEKMGDP